MLYRLMYKSVCRIDDAALEAELARIHDACERNNPRDNVTGALIYHEGEFAQLIEGGRAAVSRTLKRLLDDPRHDEVEILAMGETPKRDFAQFAMMVVKIDGWFAAEIAEFTVGDRFRIGDLNPDGLAHFMGAVERNLQARSAETIAMARAR